MSAHIALKEEPESVSASAVARPSRSLRSAHAWAGPDTGGTPVPPLRVLMVAGATGGHIFPALTVAEELVARSSLDSREEVRRSLVFLGTTRGLEARVIPKSGFTLRTVVAAGLKGIGGWKRLMNLAVLPQSAFETAQLLRDFRPDVVVGVGGYLAGPAMVEAALMNIPTLLIEPNAVPGFTNRVLGPIVSAAAVGFERTAGYYGGKARVTGHPVRRAFSEIRPKPHVPPLTVLIVGGSQGSRAINECATKVVPLLLAKRSSIRVVHQTGERDYNVISEAYVKRGLDAEVCAFIDDMPKAFAHADLVVSRAGATAVAELAAAGKAAVLIPFPGATDQHQLENARAMEQAGAARVIEQHHLTPELLAAQLEELLSDAGQLLQTERSARSLARPDAAERIADWVVELGRKNADH